MKVEFSVIIPVFNKAEFLAETLMRALAQDYSDFEVIIVDDGSTDNGLEIIRPFLDHGKVQLLQQPNKGVSAARNLGIKNARYDYIALLDADDLWEPGHLSQLAEAIDACPDDAVYATNSYLKSGNFRKKPHYSVKLHQPIQKVDFFEASRIDSIINSSTAAIKKEAFQSVGLFNEDLVRSEDTDMWIRLGAKYQVVFSNTYTVTILRHPAGLSQKQVAASKLLDFSQYTELEQTNRMAKKFLDLNRYSLAISCKLNGDKQQAKEYASSIAYNSLNNKQWILLKLPGFLLKLMLSLKNMAAMAGLDLSSYK